MVCQVFDVIYCQYGHTLMPCVCFGPILGVVLQFLDTLDSYSAPPAASGANLSAATDTLVTTKPPVSNPENAQSVLDFLDEITQRSSTPTATVQPSPRRAVTPLSSSITPGPSTTLSRSSSGSLAGIPRRSGESLRTRPSVTASPAPAEPIAAPAPVTVEQLSAAPAAAEGGWGSSWSSVWTSATTIVQQARTVAEEQVKTAANASSITAGIGGIGEGLMKALGENEQAKKFGEGVISYAKAAHLDKLGACDRLISCLQGLTRSLLH